MNNGTLESSQVELLPVGSIVVCSINGIPDTSMGLVCVPGGLAPIFILSEQSGAEPPEGEPVGQFGNDFYLVKNGRGKIVTHKTAQLSLISWFKKHH